MPATPTHDPAKGAAPAPQKGHAALDVDIDWRGLVGRLHEGFVVGELIRKDGEPVDYAHLYVNEAWRAVTGLDPDLILGRPTREVLSGLDEGWVRDMARVVETGEPLSVTRYAAPMTRWYDYRVFPLGGDRFGLVVVDVTRREARDQAADQTVQDLPGETDRHATTGLDERTRTWTVTPDLLCVFDMQGVFEQVNPAWLRTLGWTPGEMVGRSLFDTLHPDDLAATTEKLSEVQGGKPVLRFENRHRHVDGTYRTISWVAVPEGQRVYCTGRDVTEEKAQEAELAASTAERTRLWDTSRDLFVIIDPDGLYRDANPAWTERLGHEREALIGARMDALVHPDDVAAARDAFALTAEGGVLRDFVCRVRGADGAYVRFEWTAYPSGGVVFAQGRDVEVRLSREEELRERTAERDRVWRASRDLYVTIGLDGLYRAANPAWEREMGYAPAELIGTRFDVLAHPDDRPVTERRFAEVVDGLFLTDHEIRVRRKDGRYRWYSFTVFEDGGSVVAVGRDIEERRARETELAAAETALRQSQKLEMIGQLTGGIAHDFNNLLAAVQSSLGLLRKRLPPADGRARDLLDNAVKGTERGAALTQRMLSFARQQELEAGPVDIPALLGGMADLLRRSLGPGVRVETITHGEVPPALVDANQLEMAVLNLAVNARDAMEGRGELTFCIEAVELAEDELPAGRYVRLLVMDDGPGMDEATLARAAEPFFTTKGVGKGTGLGLASIHGLAAQSGGRFALTSPPGEGLRAELLLPAAEDAATAAAPIVPSASGALPQAAPSGRRLRVLAVDDDFLVLLGTTGMLEDAGHEVVEASSGQDALALIEQDDGFDVVLTDHAMPGMTGVQLAEAGRALRPGLPFVLVTGFAELPEGSERLIHARLGKPFGERALAELLDGLPARAG